MNGLHEWQIIQIYFIWNKQKCSRSSMVHLGTISCLIVLLSKSKPETQTCFFFDVYLEEHATWFLKADPSLRPGRRSANNVNESSIALCHITFLSPVHFEGTSVSANKPGTWGPSLFLLQVTTTLSCVLFCFMDRSKAVYWHHVLWVRSTQFSGWRRDVHRQLETWKKLKGPFRKKMDKEVFTIIL